MSGIIYFITFSTIKVTRTQAYQKGGNNKHIKKGENTSLQILSITVNSNSLSQPRRHIQDIKYNEIDRTKIVNILINNIKNAQASGAAGNVAQNCFIYSTDYHCSAL